MNGNHSRQRSCAKCNTIIFPAAVFAMAQNFSVGDRKRNLANALLSRSDHLRAAACDLLRNLRQPRSLANRAMTTMVATESEWRVFGQPLLSRLHLRGKNL